MRKVMRMLSDDSLTTDVLKNNRRSAAILNVLIACAEYYLAFMHDFLDMLSVTRVRPLFREELKVRFGASATFMVHNNQSWR